MKIKKGDNIILLAGKDKGKTGKVLRALPKENKVIVEGLNVVKRHKKPRQEGKKGEIVDIFAPINVSNVALDNKASKKAEIAGKSNKKVQTSKKDK